MLERHASQTAIKTLADAAFWTTTQLLTVSSSLKNPISTGARILDVIMEIYAITVVAALAGAFGSFLQNAGKNATPTTEPTVACDGALARHARPRDDGHRRSAAARRGRPRPATRTQAPCRAARRASGRAERKRAQERPKR
jgi:hypothetical protein